MTVRELIAQLEKMDPDRTVILQHDAEGNGYSPLAGIDDNAIYTSEIVCPEVLTKELVRSGFTEDDLYDGDDDPIRAVVLFPIN